ncbi:MAG: hypothetical protein OHK0017_09370 [Patescibacteria group bacterium]
MSKNSLIHYLDSVFEDSLGLRPLMTATRAMSSVPALNIQEYNDRFEISLSIPGIDPAEVKVELADQVLTITYSHEDKNEESSSAGKLIRQEYDFYSFSRSIRLPKNVDESSVKAKSSRGILTITIQKLPESQPKKVDIEIDN